MSPTNVLHACVSHLIVVISHNWEIVRELEPP